jgi:glycine/D-amino acid oxidase-like deaminating enzyme
MTKPRNRNGSPHVVVVGGGFAGLAAIKTLDKAKPPVKVTLLEQHNYHLFQPLLYQLATGLVQPADIAHPVRGIVRRYRRTSVRMATVSGVDFDAKQVLTDEGRRFGYDYLILAAGATTATFGIPGVEEHSFPLKTMPDALRLRPPPCPVPSQLAPARPRHPQPPRRRGAARPGHGARHRRPGRAQGRHGDPDPDAAGSACWSTGSGATSPTTATPASSWPSSRRPAPPSRPTPRPSAPHER